MATPRKGHYGKEKGQPIETGGQACMLTPELHEQLVKVRKTTRLFDTQVAILCGISKETLKYWLEKGITVKAIEPYRSFAHDYVLAAIDKENEALIAIEKAANQDWRANAWWLENRFPKRYGPRASETGPENIEIQELIAAAQQREATLSELLANPPPELESAMLQQREAILAVLGIEVPALPEGNDKGE